MTWKLFHVDDSILNLKGLVIATNHDFTFIAQKMHKTGADAIRIGQQVHGLACDFLNQHVNILNLLGTG